MSVILGLLVSTALTGATPVGSPGKWMTDQDYPSSAKKRGEQGTVAFTLLVSPDGTPVRCEITRSSNYADLDEKSCSILIQRAKFNPARDAEGNALHTYYRSFMYWAFSRPTSLRYSADLALQVDKIPGGAKEKIISILIKTDVEGHVLACNSVETTSDDPKKFVDFACKEAAALITTPIKDNDGRAVIAIRQLKVSFSSALP